MRPVPILYEYIYEGGTPQVNQEGAICPLAHLKHLYMFWMSVDEFYRLIWTSMDFYGLLWTSMDFYGLSMDFNGLLWTSMVIYGH